MFRQLKTIHYFLLATISVLVSLGLYVFTQYEVLQNSVTTIEITFNNELSKEETPIIYTSSNTESKINFKTVYKFQYKGNLKYECKLDTVNQLRKLRLYFVYPNQTVTIRSINLKSSNKVISIPLQKFKKREGINCIEQPKEIKLEILKKYGYIELPKTYIYPSDFKNTYQLILALLVLLIFVVLVFKSLKAISIKPFAIQSITISALILSIFLPHPIFNIALIVMALLNFKNIKWIDIKTQKINFIIVGFFIIYLLNNLLISKEGFREMSTIERFLPFIILSVIIPSIANRKYLILFPISAFIIGFGFLLTSIFDVYIHQNFVFLSFDFFTKYMHPVYFSYLLFFSICFIDYKYKGKAKYILEFILFVFLIFSGSKMVFLFSLIVVFINLLKNKKTALLIIPLTIIVIIFSPLKNRFKEIINQKDMTILKDSYIEKPNDSRVNGLTLRLILWREALATMNGLDYVFGKGITKDTNKLLKNRLNTLGLKHHLTFNPHNQYVDTFWRTGILGLLLLILIPLYSLKEAIKRKDKLLIQFSLFFIVVMCSESIFGRVNGVYFFTIVILLLMNTNKINEDSHIRN
ncbi:O-antigen ligase family protein [Ichthyenterobacterium magnum]|uniref:O-antigen ligase-like membrane protein n=1 Tax=Ichthyenterobacterium magnum TaxID=1230530 RepID=A0A420DX72_9FLAO|nr:O-antigen ligase family protein [Ichthyenterobacterium magnum]RKE98838.1 O-antigen ligase-like membrane protein [Ichthyenterobacterium magnum]